MNIEFYTPLPKVFKAITYLNDGTEWKSLDLLDDNQIRIIIEQLRENHQACVALHRLQQRGITSLREKLRRFVGCNFGKIDKVPDIADDGTLNFERVDCDCRARCKDRGIVCIKK
jgi:hypothetical protein